MNDGQISFQAPCYYAPNTPVIFTFSDAAYSTLTSAVNLSRVSFRGSRHHLGQQRADC